VEAASILLTAVEAAISSQENPIKMFLAIHKNPLNLLNNPSYILVEKCLIIPKKSKPSVYSSAPHFSGNNLLWQAVLAFRLILVVC
jgi:hypothetical protein